MLNLKLVFTFLKIPLGVLPKNENKNEDMVDILETIQEKYVPSSDTDPEDFIFLGGDQLTEERARNVQKAKADGETSAERLDSLWPKNEDWHAIRTAYKVYLHCKKIIIVLQKLMHNS